jgi:hypothetical protein
LNSKLPFQRACHALVIATLATLSLPELAHAADAECGVTDSAVPAGSDYSALLGYAHLISLINQ